MTTEKKQRTRDDYMQLSQSEKFIINDQLLLLMIDDSPESKFTIEQFNELDRLYVIPSIKYNTYNPDIFIDITGSANEQ